MKKALAIGISVLALSAAGQANASDLYVPAPAPAGSYKDAPYVPETWTGFYLGINGGYGWSAQDSTVRAAGETQVCTGNVEVCNPQTVTQYGTKSFGTDGGFGGGQIGYNYQRGSIVLGVEADIQGSAIDGSGTVNLANVSASATGKNDLDWFGTLRGRLGYAAGGTLVYFTGGFAFGGVTDTLTVKPAQGASSTVSSSSTNTGYVLGGGVEQKINPSWSVKAEYQYFDLGHDWLYTSAGNPGYQAVATYNAEHSYNTVRLGLNYHIGSTAEPLK
jgi:outer membrane immunogenic protein